MATIAKTIIVTEYLHERAAIDGISCTSLIAVYLAKLKLTSTIFLVVSAFMQRQTF